MTDRKQYALAAIRAIEQAGGKKELARRLSIIRRQRIEIKRVQNWRYIGVPSKFVIDVEVITGIPREELRPDIFYPVAS